MVVVGRILKSRGNKGEAVLNPVPGTELFFLKEGTPVTLKSEKYTLEKEVEYVRQKAGQLVCKFRGVDSIAAVLKIIGYSLYVDSSLVASAGPRPSQPDLQGYEVWDVQGSCWGRVTAVRTHHAQTLLEVRPPAGGAEESIPWHEGIVRSVDHRRKKILIDPPAGLKGLNK